MEITTFEAPKKPEGVELPNPQNSIDHEDVAPIEEVNYDDA